MTLDIAQTHPAHDTDWVAVAASLAAEAKKTAPGRERNSELPTEELAKVRETGLVNLLIPTEFGGGGGNWQQTVRVIVEFGKADPNIGTLLAYHYHNYQPPWLDYVNGAEVIQRRSAENRWLWGHVTQPRAKDFSAIPQPDGGYILRGTKPMNTGPATGDVMNVTAEPEGREELIYVVIPTDREGVVFHNDWDHLGLRRTNTSAITFNDVAVAADEVIPTPEPLTTISRWYIINGAFAFAASYLGAALGVLEEVRDYLGTKTIAHPIRATSPALIEVPFIQAEVGRLWSKAQAALAYLDQITREYDEAFARDPSPDNVDLDWLNARTEIFRVYAARLGIDAGAKLYDFLGSSATANKYNFDRYWRDVRIHSLHGGAPLYGDKAIGDYYVNGQSRRPNLSALFAGGQKTT